MTNYEIVRHPNVADDLLDITFFIADYASNDVAARKLAEAAVQSFNALRGPIFGFQRRGDGG